MSATTAPTTGNTPAHGRSKAVNIILWVAQGLLAAFFVFAALPKLLGDATTVQTFNDIGAGQWFRYLTGVVELAGAIGLVIPVLSGLASLGLVGVMIGATYVNIVPLGLPSAAVTTVVLGVVFALVAWGRAPHNKRLLGLLRR